MPPLAFRLRGEFVEYGRTNGGINNDMTVNVGLGTGDKQQQLAVFGNLLRVTQWALLSRRSVG